MTRRHVALMTLAAVLAVGAVAAILVLRDHRTLQAFTVRDGHPELIHLESPCSRWQDLVGDCAIPAGTF